jgi:hypothetical protein
LATYSLLGVLFALFRPLAALVGGVTVGLISRVLEKEKEDDKLETPKHIHTTRKIRLRDIISYGFGELPVSIGKWILIGILVGGLISFLVPDNFVERYMGSATFLGHIISYAVMLLVGIPMYVCATGAIPIVASLIAKGMCPGAGLVFLIAGPATNSVTIAVIGSMVGKRGLFIYIGGTLMMALAVGLIFDFIWNFAGKSVELIAPGGEMLTFPLKLGAGLILVFVILRALFKGGEKMGEYEYKYKFKIPDMSCVHCKTKIEEALGKIPGINFLVDLDTKTVLVNGETDEDTLKKTIGNLGYKLETE